MKEAIEQTHERIDDIPLIIGLAQHLQLPEVLDRHLGNHGHHQGVSYGWLAYILTEGDQRKSSVQEWVDRHQHTLERLHNQDLRAGECNDDPWGSSCSGSVALEADLWAKSVLVYELAVEGVRLDSTIACSNHTTQDEGLMQVGHSKVHRPDLAQVKLMAAAAEPSGHLLACDVYQGQRADDQLYLPLFASNRRGRFWCRVMN
jgi:transposase